MSVKKLLRIAAIALALGFAAVAHAQTESMSAAAAASAAQNAAAAAAKSAAAAASSAEIVVSNAWAAPHTFLLYLVPSVAFFGSLVSILAIRGALKPTKWSLAESLSEEVSVPVYTETTNAGVTTRQLVYDRDGKPVLVPELKASTSRVIALMGLIAILFLFIGFGVFALFSFGSVGRLPQSMGEVVTFLVAGLTLFAPYFVNKFASLFQGIVGGK